MDPTQGLFLFLFPFLFLFYGLRFYYRFFHTLAMDVMHHSSYFLLPTIPQAQLCAQKHALVLLNQSLPSFTPRLWDITQLRVCADGGSNRLYDEMPQFFSDEDPSIVRHRYKPDVITGDLDSIRTDVRDFYESLGTMIIDKSFDQDTTDLHKCVAYIRSVSLDYCILVADPFGGRFDHEMGNLNVLYTFSTTRMVFLNDDNLVYLLPKTHRHEIKIESSVEGPNCGLIPLGMPSSSCTTTGLKWNLDHADMRFGGLISTSNRVTDEIVTVQSDSNLLWIISLKK